MRIPGTPTLVATLTGSQSVYTTALLNNQLFLTRDYNGQVLVYDKTSMQLLRTITFSGFSAQLYGLVTSAIDNYLYVGDFRNAKVHRVDLSVTSTVSVVTWSVPGQPCGLSMTSENTVLVATNNKTIEERTPSGSLVRSITMRSSVWQAVQVNHDVWAFTYSGFNQICTILTNGTVIKCFGSPAGPALTPAMSSPRGVVIDARGYMLVVDQGNSRILLVDPTLSSARQLQLPVNPPLQNPLSVSYDSYLGRLYVGEYIGQSRVLVFDDIWW